MQLKHKKCAACHDKDIKPLEREDTTRLLEEISGWELSENSNVISKEFIFETFIQSVDFINQVADIAEMEGHHPDIHCFYNKVRLDISTHSVSGLTENDFILAAKIDGMLM